MVMFDANMILRYILNDNKEMADKAEKYITENNVVITLEVVAEVIYVLRKVYGADRQATVEMITMFLDLVECKDSDILKLSLVTYSAHNLDFVDCILYAYNKIYDFEIATFDKKLLRLIDNEVQ